MRGLFAIGLAFLCGGCVSTGPAEGRLIGRYLGLVEVRAEVSAKDPPGVVRRDTRVLGAWAEASPRAAALESVGLGWRANRQLLVPHDCRLVVIVRSAAELDSVRTLLRTEQVKEGELCVLKD